MLIKFHSEESAEFVMLADTADQLLAKMGHGGSTEGSISGEALGSALNRLSSAITRNEEQAGVSESDEQNADDWDEEDDDESEAVTLSARAAPLVTMLRRARDADGYVMWRPE